METPFRVDESVAQALRDEQTITAEGASVATTISGVQTHSLINHVDHRGRVFEIYPGPSPSGFWVDPVVYCYCFTVRPMQTKGWGLHLEKVDRYTLIDGEVLTILHDARLDSPTHGVTQKVVLSPQSVRQLMIPVGVWHMNVNLGEREVMLINHPTKAYVHEQPDRLMLPWNTSALPIDVAGFFPVQRNFAVDCDCS
jgi:dTDP-4-dehydrorhamnose 3,5-epimerase